MLSITVPHLLTRCEEAVFSAEGLLAAAKTSVSELVTRDGKISSQALDREQRATHGLAWLATYVEALRQMARWGRSLEQAKKFGEIEQLILLCAFAEYLAQLPGGIAMSQNEVARPFDMGLGDDEISGFWSQTISELVKMGTRPEVRAGIVDHMVKHQGAMFVGEPGLDDTMSMIRDQFFRFAQEKVTPFAHQWHLKDELIPIEVIKELSDLGVFGLTIPENYGGACASSRKNCPAAISASDRWRHVLRSRPN
jgi:(2S)-methylsuccinyl-CoA dehydrogenase